MLLWKEQLGDSIDVTEDRDNWDYILHLDRLKNLEGKKLKSLRQGRNTFDKAYEYEVEELSPKIFDELREFQAAAEKDLQSRVTKLQDAVEDDATFQFALNHWDKLKNLFGFVVRVDGRIFDDWRNYQVRRLDFRRVGRFVHLHDDGRIFYRQPGRHGRT